MTHRLFGVYPVRLCGLPWHTSRNGSQVDINCYVPEERRELTIAADVREDCAGLLAAAPELLSALRAFVGAAEGTAFVTFGMADGSTLSALDYAKRAIEKAEAQS